MMTIPGYDASKDGEKAFFTGKLGGVFQRASNKIRFGNATQETALFSTWPTKRTKTNSAHLGELGVAGYSVEFGSHSAQTEYESSGVTTTIPPGGYEDVLLPFASRSMVGVVIGVIPAWANYDRVQLIGRKYFDMGTILVLQPSCLSGPFLHDLQWPCPDFELFQAVQGTQTPHSLPVGQILSERSRRGATVSSITREAGASDQARRYSRVSSALGGWLSSRIGEAKVPDQDQGVSPQANVERRQVGNDTVAGEEMKTSPGVPQEVRSVNVHEAPERRNDELVGSDGEEEIEGGGGSPEGRGEGESSQDSDDWNSKARQYAREGHSGVDRLGYSIYAEALAGLFSTGEENVLPAAVGVYAPWGAGKSFLLNKLKKLLGPPESPWSATWCCCVSGLLRLVTKSVLIVIVAAIVKALWRWCRACGKACGKSCLSTKPEAKSDEESAGSKQDASSEREFIVVEFNAWECAGSDVLWAAVITKIFDAVEGHRAFGRGAVRAARIHRVLEDPTWNWCGLATFYIVIAAGGIVLLNALHWTGLIPSISIWLGWVVATLVPGSLTLLKLLLQIRSRGSLGAAQSVLRKAISKRESVGESYLGFMSDVREELEVVFDMINNYNERGRGKSKAWLVEKLLNTCGKSASEKKLALTVIVDDLDRCPEEQVMEMLKATHLLLEHPKAPMVVFLAVDPQLIISAIANSLDGVPNTMKALQYLDKIIHLPFCIPPISATKRLNLLETLLNGNNNSCRKTIQRLKKCLAWSPSKKELEEHQMRDILGPIPDVLELVCYLDRWVNRRPRTAPPPPSETIQDCFRLLKTTKPTDIEPFCLHLFEELNKDINKVLSRNDGPSSGVGSGVPPGETASHQMLHRTRPENNSPFSGARTPPSSANTGSGLGGQPRRTQVPEPVPSTPSRREVVEPPSTALNGSVVARVPTPGGTSVGSASTLGGTVTPPALFLRGVSSKENETFIALFRVVKATPRKVKRVVNIYFLQRYLAQATRWKREQAEKRAQELITWTILAEFWPFRLSCIAFLMANARRDASGASQEEPTIASVYEGSPRTSSVSKWIEENRVKEGKNTKDLLMSDDSERRFRAAINAGAEITRRQVVYTLMANSFNLNPAMMSVVEEELDGWEPENNES